MGDCDTYSIYRSADLPGVEVVNGRSAGRSSTRHMHEHYRIGLAVAGRWGTRYQGTHYDVTPGTIQLAEPRELSVCEMNSEPQQFQAVVLDAALIDAVAAEPGGRRGFVNHIVRDNLIERSITGFVDAVIGNASLLERSSRLHAVLVTVLGDARWSTAVRLPTARCAGVVHAKQFIDDEPAADFTLAQLAELAGLSPSHFSREFRREIGLPPHAYLLHRRIERAKVALAGDTRMSEVSASLGFYDQSHFHRHFRRQVGVTPATYRQALAG